MHIPTLISALLLTAGLCAMENKVTIITINPDRDPELFFTVLDERIQSQVEGAQKACNERNAAGMIECLNNLAILLNKAQLHHNYLLDGYPHKGPLAKDAKRKKTFDQDAEKSFIYSARFEAQTKKLIEVLAPTPIEPITDEEWPVMQELFRECMPGGTLKKLRSAPDN